MAILVFTVFGDEDRTIGAIESGACGYLLRGLREQDLLSALRQVAEGVSPISPAIARRLLSTVRSSESAPLLDEGLPSGADGAPAVVLDAVHAAHLRELADVQDARLVDAPVGERPTSPPASSLPAYRSTDEHPYPGDRLTPREHEVLRLVAQGLSAEEIGTRISVSVHTVRAHIRNIYAKLHVGRRVQAISAAQRLGYL